MKKQDTIIVLRALGVQFDETATNEVLEGLLKDAKDKAVKNVPPAPTVKDQTTPTLPGVANESETVSVSKKEWDDVQKQLKMLVEVADKGRVYNYQNSNKEKKPFKVKLSIYKEAIIVGWKTIKDELVKHATTGKTIGEQQEYELKLLGKDADGNYTVESTTSVNGYPNFSDARYSERIEVEVVGKSEDYEGNIKFDTLFPDGRKISLNSRFVN